MDLKAQITRALTRSEPQVSRVLAAEQLHYPEFVFVHPKATLQRHSGLHAYCQSFKEESLRPFLDDDYVSMGDALGL
jgi:hypothetical protein